MRPSHATSPDDLAALLRRARMRHALRLALPVLVVLVLLLAARALWGQQRIPGVGLPIPASIPAAWRSQWCPQLRPPADWAPPAEAIAAGWDWRAQCPSRGWSGWFAEWFPRTTGALRQGWDTDRWGTRNSHTGAYTVREFEYAEVYWDKCGSEYAELWWGRAGHHEDGSAQGGTREHPYTITAAGSAAHAAMVEQARAAGAWPAYMETGLWASGPAPCTRWPFWIRNEVGDAGGPQPTPSPSPVVTPTPTATPPVVATPTPSPTAEPCPECMSCRACPPDPPPCPTCKPQPLRCLDYSDAVKLTMLRVRQGRRPSAERLIQAVEEANARRGCCVACK